jgi:(1->4)-alpha-D-glucan 1-alpha-D-glucosylmutase
MQKATKEAKVHTSWVNPNEEYDAAMREFVARLLPDDPKDPFLADLRPLQQRVAFFGAWGALAQLQLKLACPGVTDLYQGTELWSYTLVDPDNRGAVDYRLRRNLLAEIKGLGDLAGAELTAAVRKLVETMQDGRIKLYVTSRGLTFRRAHGPLFLDGAYAPLEATGAKAAHVCAFARTRGDEAVLVAVPRLVVGLTGGEERAPLGDTVWQDTRLLLPPGEAGRQYRNLYTGEVLTAGAHEEGAALALAEVLAHFPVALLERQPAGQPAGRA